MNILWGVQPFVLKEAGEFHEQIVDRVDDYLLARDVVREGDRLVVVARREGHSIGWSTPNSRIDTTSSCSASASNSTRGCCAFGTMSLSYTPEIGNSGLTGLVYIDGRMTSDYNTGSDLFPQKEQDGYALFNARVGIRGAEERWALELWAQNLFDVDYAQVAFNSPFQAGTTSAPFVDPQYPGGRQIFSQFLAEPRTYGITGRFRF